MRFVPIDEVEQQQPQPLKFVPIEEANKQPQEQQPQALKFVPIENMPATPLAQTLSGEQDEFTRPAKTAPKENKVLEAYRAIHGDDETSELKRAANSLHAGWDSIVSSWRGNQMSQAGEFIARLEEKFGKGAQNAPPDKQQEYKEAVDLYTKAAIDRRNIAIDQQRRYQETPKRQATQEFNAAQAGFDSKELSFLQSAAKAGEAFMSNPVGVATDIGLESLPATLASAAAAIFARYSLGSSLLGAGAGGVVSGITEFGNEYAERRTKGEDHDQAWSNAAQKSGVIGLLDAVSMYSAGSAAGEVMSALTGTKRIGDAVKTTLKETGKQAALGAAGEAGGSLLIGETPNPAAVMAEAIGETVGAPLEGVANYRATKPTTIEDRAIAGLESLSSEEEPARQRVEPTFEDTAAPKRRSLNELEQDFIDAKSNLRKAKSRFDSLTEESPEEEQIEAKNAFDEAGNRFDRVTEELNAAWESTDFGFAEETTPPPADQETEQRVGPEEAQAAIEEANNVEGTTYAVTEYFPFSEDSSTTDVKVTRLSNGTVVALKPNGNSVVIPASQAVNMTDEEIVKSTLPYVLDAENISIVKKEVSTNVDIAALEQEELARHDAVRNIVEQQKALLTKAGRIPAKNSKNRAEYDNLEKQRIEAHWNWVASEQNLDRARKAAQPKAEEILNEEEVPAVSAANELREAEAEADRIFDEDLATAWNNLQNAPEERRELYQQQHDEASKKWHAATDRVSELREAKNKPAFKNIFIPPIPDNQRDQQGADNTLAAQEELVAPRQAGRLPSLKRQIAQINKEFQEGRITAEEHAERTKDTLELHNLRLSRQPIRPRSRGANFIRQKLLEAKRRGEISERASDLAEWFILRNPELVSNLGISIRQARRNENNTAGAYDSFAQIMTLIKNTGVDDTTVHEIFHHLERMMPREVQDAIRNAWRNNFRKAQRQAEQGDYDSFSAALGKDLRIFFDLLNDYHFGTARADTWTQAIRMLTNGSIPIQFYQYVSPSEFWAVNATNIMQNRYDFSNSVMDRLRNWMREFREKAKSFFNLTSKAPLIRAIDSLLRGDGRFQSARMLGEGAIFESKKPSGWSQAEPVSAEEQKVQEQFRKSGELHPDVVEAINNNDINGALNLVANRLTGFYANLANRLAALNLQTAITLENARGIAQQGVLKTVGPELQRVMSYVRVANPAYYANYFEGFDREENFTRVKTGLASIAVDTLHFPEKAMRGEGLSQGKYYYPAIANELRAVNDAYHDYGDVLYAQGAYINMFDIIVLNAKHNGNTYRVFLHEVVHAATVSLMRAEPSQLTPEQLAAREEINKLYELAKKNIKTQEYGLKNKYEFVAELFTNDTFRNLLKQIPYPAARTNVLSRIYSAILKLVGVDNVASRAMVEAEKMFTASRYQTTKAAGPLFSKPKRSYKKGPIASSWRSVESLVRSKMPWRDAAPHIGNLIWNIATGPVRIGMLGALELRHLSDLTKTKFPQIAASVRIIEQMTAERGKIMTKAADIAKEWKKQQSKNAAQSRLLGRLMLEATLSGVEVDNTNTTYYNAAKVKPQVQAAWNALKPEFKDLYRKVRNFYKNQVDEMVRTLRAQANTIQDPERRQRVLDAIAHDFGPGKLIFPYFPLKRFGDHWFQVGSGRFTEFYEFESYAAREVALLKRKLQLLKGNAAQRKLAEEIEKGNSISQLNKKLSDVGEALRTVNELVDALSDQIVDQTTGTSRAKTIDEVKGELRDDLNQLIYTLLPQQSVRKMMMNRKGTQGASEDMLRVFTNSAVRLAYQQARLKYSTAFLSNLQAAREHINDMGTTRTAEQKEVFRDFVNEVEKRYKPMLGLEDTSTSAKIAGMASDFITFMLMSAPFSAILNTLGFAQLGATALGGKYGYIKATDHLTDNFVKYMGSTVERTLVPIKNGQVLSVQFPSAMESSKLKGLDKLAAQQLMDEEQVNVSQTYDLVSVGGRPSELSLSKYEAIKAAVFLPFHQLERFNREMLLLSAFQLEYEKLTSNPKKESNGIVIRDAQGNPETYQNDSTTPDGVPYSKEAYDLALGNAKDLAGITLGETTRQMRPRYFMNAVAALPLKFKRYAITAFYAVIRSFNQGVISPFSKEEVNQMRDALEADNIAPDIIDQRIKEMETFRKELASEGRKTLAGILGVTASLSGTVGLPIYSIVFPVLIKMLAPDDDDDEFFNWDNWYRNYMENEFGGYAGAMLTKLGMNPDSAVKLGRKIGESVVIGPISVATGGAFTERTSLDFKSLLFRDAQYFADTRDAVKEFFMMVLGAGAGTALTLADGYELLQQGQTYRAWEKFMPAVINKPMTAYRYAQEGARTRSGELIIDDFTGTELAMQAIGLQPTRLAQKQKASIQAKEKEQKIIDKHDTIVNKLWMERDNPEAFNKIFLDEAVLFSTKHPAYAITPKKLNESFKQRMKNQVMAESMGAKISKPLRQELAPMLEYGKE